MKALCLLPIQSQDLTLGDGATRIQHESSRLNQTFPETAA